MPRGRRRTTEEPTAEVANPSPEPETTEPAKEPVKSVPTTKKTKKIPKPAEFVRQGFTTICTVCGTEARMNADHELYCPNEHNHPLIEA